MFDRSLLLACLGSLLLLPPIHLGAQEPPIVIAHRGASGYRPEHTLASYQLAIDQGADFIEPDLVLTRDGVLIARHEHVLAAVRLGDNDKIALVNGRPVVTQATTNIADLPQFADYLTVKLMGGRAVGGWFSEDLTLAQIKTLRARERIPGVRPGSAAADDQLQIPTLGEVIDLVVKTERSSGRVVGIYPETKHPTYFAREGYHLDVDSGESGERIAASVGRKLIEILVAKNFTDPERIFIQSFEVENLRELQHEIMPTHGIDLPLVQLLGSDRRTYDMRYNEGRGGEDQREIYGALVDLVADGMLSSAVLAFMASDYAEGIGPAVGLLLPRTRMVQPVDGDGDGRAQIRTRLTGEVAPLLAEALALGLEVHPYTLRAEEQFLTADPDGKPQTITETIHRLLELGCTGFFIDQPDIGVAGRNSFLDK